ncbi:choice-of-anchor L domain-containing protein [Bizionia sp. KMM 8389]
MLTGLLLAFVSVGFAQQISINDTYTAQQLIEDQLIDGCVEISNVQSLVNGQVNNINSFGYFERGNSAFPFENGIILSTGAANSAGNINNANLLNDGEADWLTDADLESALEISNTLNATSIEFDFISVSNQVQFNYILASEEYYANYPCQYSDGFAFLIKEAGTADPYVNVSVIPDTDIPVNTSTIHEEVVGFCPAENQQYFGGYDLGDTNFNGRTTVLTASATIQPNVEYHIKLVIADQNDENFDSAVFIQGNSFNSTVNLGPDLTTCADAISLNGDIQNSLANYQWLLDGVIIAGETNPTLNVITSGTYTVSISIPINNTICEIEDSVNITLSSEQSAGNIPDYIVCDDASNDGVELFDLSTKDTQVLAAVPPGNYTISYHFNTNDAQSGSFPINTPILNSVSSQTIYVRILDTDNGCLAYGSFLLVVNPLPNITAPAPLEVCDDGNGDGYTLIDLSLNNDIITGGNPNYAISYHYNQSDAETGTNPVPTPYNHVTTSDILYVSVQDTITGCRNTTILNITVLEGPNIDSQIQTIDACEQDEDGFESFDLSVVIPDILNGLTNVTTTFHESYTEAQTGANPIPDITNYTNTQANFQVIYIRVIDNVTGCPAIASIELHANLIINETNIRNFYACDDASNDGVADFNLVNISNLILNGVSDVTIYFYETETDQQQGTNPIDQTLPYQVENFSEPIFITLESADCNVQTEIELIINPALILQPLPPVTYCNDQANTFALIDLYSFDNTVAQGFPNANVTYFETEQNAMDNLDPLPRYYNNTSNPLTLFVRVADAITGCNDVGPLEIEVLPAPATNTPSDVIICDDDQDAYSIVNLDAKISELTNDTTGLNISFYTNITDAEANNNPIVNTDTYNAQTQIIYTRVERIATGCFVINDFEIIINTEPVFIDIPNFNNCETDGDQIAEFIFEDKDAEILNGQPGKRVLYFENELDAINRVNIIEKTTVYENTSNPQLIHIRVENIRDTNCYGLDTFYIEVGSVPIYNPPLDTFLCDDITNDAQETFDLTLIQDEMSQGSTDNLLITFYENLDDAENAENAISLNYTNQSNPQQIYTRIENGTYCYGIASFGLNVIQVPRVNQASLMQECDIDYNSKAIFDLTVAESEVLDIRQDDILVSYHENLNDLEANINEIPNPEAYENTESPQTVYIRVTNTVSNCYVTVPLDLEVNLPPAITPISNYNICESTDNTFNLEEVTNSLIDNNDTQVLLTYHASQADAYSGANALDTNYNYSSNADIIHVRAENTLSGCFATSSFTLLVNPTPIAHTPANLEACDDNYDGLFVFDLSQQTNSILGGQSATNYSVTYFELEIEAIENTNPITNLNYNAFHEQVIYARIENNITHCFNTTSFTTIIHRKPLVEIPTQTVCLDNLPLVVSAETGFDTDSYLWSTNATTPEIEITQIGTYRVTVTTDLGCTTTVFFDVIESEQATIEFTETVDFSNPNNITVTISGIGNYVYILDEGVPQTSNVFYNVSLGPHTIEVYDLNGCASATKDIVIIDAPRFFTPNQDGQNDTWHITGVTQIPGTIVYIFDRYGKLLKTLSHSSSGWDGTYNGHNMPSDDYWFLAKVKKGDIMFDVKRHFTLKR